MIWLLFAYYDITAHSLDTRHIRLQLDGAWLMCISRRICESVICDAFILHCNSEEPEGQVGRQTRWDWWMSTTVCLCRQMKSPWMRFIGSNIFQFICKLVPVSLSFYLFMLRSTQSSEAELLGNSNASLYYTRTNNVGQREVRFIILTIQTITRDVPSKAFEM